ncbi:MAG: hypothetical protein E7513_03865 [Ruminococcaceae bacterium]|nr:hypothetical protein [Oscillospiraceae bacterium]
MSEFNFDKLKNLEIPDSWVDGALNVPPESEKAPVVFVNFTRSFAAVASLVLVCSLSLLLFFLTDDNATPPIDKKVPTSETSVTSTESFDTNNSTENTEKELATPFDKVKDFIHNLFIKPTQKPSSSAEKDEEPTGSTHPSKPSEETKNDEENSSSTTLPSTSIETQSVATEPQEPTQEVQTQPPTQEPTEKPDVNPTEVHTQPPTQKPTQKPTQEPTMSINDFPDEPFVIISSYPVSGWNSTTEVVYCRLYDANGNLVGDSDLYSSQHLAKIDSQDSKRVYVSYDPQARGLAIPVGEYSFCFYNLLGTVLVQGYIYVS